jgi:hypothetical protein
MKEITSRIARLFTALILVAGIATLGTSCATNDGPKPPRERISSLPQNLPQSWEGQSRLGGMPTSY